MKSSELLRLLKKENWIIVRQTGSHMTMEHSLTRKRVVIPFHGSKEVGKGLLSLILKETDIKTNKR